MLTANSITDPREIAAAFEADQNADDLALIRGQINTQVMTIVSSSAIIWPLPMTQIAAERTAE